VTLQGKGFFIWQIRNCEGGNVSAIANTAATAGFTHVLIKIADGASSYNINQTTGADLVPPLVAALRAKGISPWGWHYVYGDDPSGEATKAIQRVQQLGLDGYVIDAESEYSQPGRDAVASRFMSLLRASLPSLPIALSSYRFPTYHPALPWQEFLDQCDYNMPQVYWLQATNAGEQLTRCVNEFQAMSPFRPIIPTGAAFKEGGWQATSGEVTEFLQTAQKLNLSAANFWEWANCRKNLPEVWTTIQNYPWSVLPPNQDIAQLYINALNSHSVDQVLTLYNPIAVHITAARSLQGTVNVRNWYTNFFNQVLPNATFTLTSFSGSGSTRHLTWTAVSKVGRVLDGNDTLGLVNGKISYHYSFFNVTK
jgi:hypothetical protein